MKTLRLMTIFATLSVALMTLGSCEEPAPEPTTFDFKIQITEIAAVSAKLDIDGKGKEPDLVRYMAPILKAELEAAVTDMTDDAAIVEYISSQGTAVTLPYSTFLKGLDIGTEYVIGAVAYDSDMNVFSFKVESFSTLEMDDRVVGNPSDAGNLTENIL